MNSGLLETIRKRAFDYGVALYFVAAIMMLIIPIPTWLMDTLLAMDLSLSFVILFTAMFSKEVLDMSFFPTILLFTTIFRIALRNLLHNS